MEKALQKAMEGGHVKAGLCLNQDGHVRATANPELFLLEPFFWQCLGKAMGWKAEHKLEWSFGATSRDGDYRVCELCKAVEPFNQFTKEPTECKVAKNWIRYWHSFIDHLADGGNVDDFFNNLIK